MPRTARLLALLTALTPLFLAVPARAEEAQGGGGGPPPPALPGSLDEALEQLPWDAARQGPLLVVDPKSTRPLVGAPPLPLSEGDRRVEIPSRYGRKSVSLASLTVLAPVETVVQLGRP